MNAIRHIATCTRNNRRIARFYRLIFGMEELWNDRQNSPYSFYLTDGFVNVNCLLIHPGLKRDPGVGIEHFGMFVDSIEQSENKITAFQPDTKIEASPRDGRYEDKRFNDPEGNRLEIAINPWGTAGIKKKPGIRHIAIHAQDLERLADFYQTVFSMKRVGKTHAGESTIVYLSDGDFSLALAQNVPDTPYGIQLFGIHVESIAVVQEKLKSSPRFLYEGEPEVRVAERPKAGPFGKYYLRDPDGNCVELSEEGWPL